MRDDNHMKRSEKSAAGRSEKDRPELKSRKPVDVRDELVSFRKGAGRGWVVAEKISTHKYRVRCLTHGTVRNFTSSAMDVKGAARVPNLWCQACERDCELFDTWIVRGDLRCMLKTQTDPWDMALAVVDVPDSHPAFLVAYEELRTCIPENCGIKLIEPRVLELSGKKGRGLRTAKRFQANVPLAEAQQGIVWIENVVAICSARLMPEPRPSVGHE